MQDQEKKFLGSILYIIMLIVVFVSGILYQHQYEALPVVPEVIEVTKLIEVPNIIETTRVIEKECPNPLVIEDKKGWFK